MNAGCRSGIVGLLVALGGFAAGQAGVTNTTPLRTFAMRAHVFDVGFSPDGRTILTSGAYGEAALWDPATGSQRLTFQGLAIESTNHSCATFSGDGRFVLTAQADSRSALLWDATTNRVLRAFTTPLANVGVAHAAISSNAAYIATCERGTNAVRVWDRAGGRLLMTLFGHAQGALSCTFAPDGATLATGGKPVGRSSAVHLWNLVTWQTRLTIPHRDQVYAVAYAPDGSRIVTVDRDGTAPDGVATVWQATSGLKLRQFIHGPTPVLAAVFAPDGTQILTGSEDGQARLWEVASGELVCTFWCPAGAGSALRAVAFSPDGRKILTAHLAGFAALWEVPQAVKLDATRTPDGVVCLTWSPTAQEAGFILQQCPDLLQGDWVEVVPSQLGRHEIPSVAGARLFFRLARF
jgi:WD40 repeat protein